MEKLLKLQQIMTVRYERHEIKFRNGVPMGLDIIQYIEKSEEQLVPRCRKTLKLP